MIYMWTVKDVHSEYPPILPVIIPGVTYDLYIDADALP